MEQPLVSVIIPTYSRPDNICRAIDSVLAQTYKNIEVIVIDDNGEGTPHQIETENILSKYIHSKKINYIKHKSNKNGSAARNTGVNASVGDLIALMDDDDYYLPTKIEEQVICLHKSNSNDESYRAVYCNTIWRVPHGDKYIMNNKSGTLSEELLTEKVTFNSSTILIYKSIYQELGGFDERYLRHQDWEFLIRYFRKYKIALARPDTQLLIKYMGPNALTRNPIKAIFYCEFFLSNFSNDIQKMKNPNSVYHIRYIELGKFLIRTGYIKEGINYLKKANKNQRFSFFEYFLIIRCFFGRIAKKIGLW